MKKILILIFFIIATNSAIGCQSFETISMDFVRTVKRNDVSETVKGTIYYEPTKTTLKTSVPLVQWMIFKGKETLVFYPNEMRAFRLKSNTPNTLPFFQYFIGVIQEDYGLSEFGYTLQKNEIKGDTLFVHWQPPQNAEKYFGKVRLALVEDKIIFSESTDNFGKMILKIEYENYFQFQNKYLPLKITITKYLGTNCVTEEVLYSNPVINQPLPDDVVNFNISPDLEIKE